MESAFFYNTFFAVAKVDILTRIQSLPEDVANHIGTFFYSKEIVGMERINRLYALQEKYKARTEYDWIQAWEKGKAHFLPKLVKISKTGDTIKYFNWGDNHILKRKDVCKFALRFAELIQVFISKCIYWSHRKPIYAGQQYTDIEGKYLIADWCFHIDESCIEYYRYDNHCNFHIDGVKMQGCERKELRWRRYDYFDRIKMKSSI